MAPAFNSVSQTAPTPVHKAYLVPVILVRMNKSISKFIQHLFQAPTKCEALKTLSSKWLPFEKNTF